MLVTFLHTRPLDYGYNASGYMLTLKWFSHQRLFLSSWPIYRMKIIRVNKEYTALKWRKYDMLFFNIRWSLINPTIYAGYFTVATKDSLSCELCLAITHDKKDYS